MKYAWKEAYNKKIMSAEQAVKMVKSGDRIVIGAATSVASLLVNALCDRDDSLQDITLIGGLLYEPLKCFLPEMRERFRFESFFLGSQDRAAHSGFTPVHLSKLSNWFRDTARPNVAFLEVSRPDEHGYVSFGASGISFFADSLKTVEKIILQINDYVPYVYGQENTLHIDQADAIVEGSKKLMELPDAVPTDVEKKIASFIVEKIPDGATIQLGIGGIANAVGYSLDCKNDLGVHTEMLTESMVYLAEKGVITNKMKSHLKDKMVISFSMGSRRMYEYMDRNPAVYAAPFRYVNDPYVIAKNDNMVSVNTALMIDLQGHIYSEALCFDQYSGTGGQVDFFRGAQLAKGGQAFSAITSTVDTKNEGVKSRIVVLPPTGSAVTTGRQDLHYVVTEYGCVNVRVLPLKERAKALIQLASPEFRNDLTAQAKELGIL